MGSPPETAGNDEKKRSFSFSPSPSFLAMVAMAIGKTIAIQAIVPKVCPSLTEIAATCKSRGWINIVSPADATALKIIMIES
jgi:hypothetical protein